MIKTSQVLSETRELLSEPDHWGQGTNGRDANGEPVGALDSLACRWCLVGGIMKTINRHGLSLDEWDQAYSKARATLASVFGDFYGSVAVWNDLPGRQHSEVIEALDKAIVKAREQEGKTNEA